MKNKWSVKILLVLGLVLALAVPVYAATYTWRCTYCGNVVHSGLPSAPAAGACIDNDWGPHNWVRE